MPEKNPTPQKRSTAEIKIRKINLFMSGTAVRQTALAGLPSLLFSCVFMRYALVLLSISCPSILFLSLIKSSFLQESSSRQSSCKITIVTLITRMNLQKHKHMFRTFVCIIPNILSFVNSFRENFRTYFLFSHFVPLLLFLSDFFVSSV